MPPVPASPLEPTPSATAVLVRQGGAAIEVYLLRRSPASSAFPGFYVFPGGTLEADDRETAFWLDHIDRAIDRPGHPLGPAARQVLPFAVAAVRETFEEAGLLLASKAGETIRPDSLSRNGKSFPRQIANHGLQLSVSKLEPWCRWISPPSMPRRFDTYFFVTAVDSGNECRPDNHETVHGMWIDPASALVENSEGRRPLSPPTLVTLHQLLEYKTIGSLMDAARRRFQPDPLMPRMCRSGGHTLIVEPWDADYTAPAVTVDVDRLEKDLLPPLSPFSRLWLHRGCWRPVANPHASGKAG